MAQRLVARSKTVRFIDFTDEIKKSFEVSETPKKSRTKLESWQISVLEKAYEDDSHPSQKAKGRLSAALGIQIKSIQIWFQNKRAKEKSKKEQNEIDSKSIPISAEEIQTSRPAYSEQSAIPSVEIGSLNDSFVLLATQDKPISSKKIDLPFTLYDAKAAPHLTMSYDECYTSVSSIFNQTSSNACSEYDSFVSSFSSPIICNASFLSKTQDWPDLSSSRNTNEFSLSESDKPFHSSNRYKYQLLNGNITYSKEDTQGDFFREMNNCIDY